MHTDNINTHMNMSLMTLHLEPVDFLLQDWTNKYMLFFLLSQYLSNSLLYIEYTFQSVNIEL